jgi:signal transduction histidine kinase/CheY-like chemotaxis protein
MKMTNRMSRTRDDLVYLRQKSLRVVMLCLVGWLYVWCAVLFASYDQFGPWWWGPVILASGLVSALALWSHDLDLAAGAAIVGFGAAQIHTIWRGDLVIAPNLLAVTVSLTALFFSRRAVIAATALCIGLVTAMGGLRWDMSLFSHQMTSSILVISAVGVFSSLAVRNLYETLRWYRERTSAAQRNEREARERRGELVRTLKALDRAYERLEHVNYDLERARMAAEKARRDRQRFASNVSHELRTPLNVILAFSETMYFSPESYGGVPLPAEYRGDVRELYRSSRHLLRLTEDVLDMSQLQAGRLKLDREPVELHQIVADAANMIRPLVKEETVALRTEVSTDLPLVSIDRSRVQQVLLNLLNNARRFTERGSITVRASQEGETVRVTVSDTGIGIPPDEQQEVFKEFHQLEAASRRARNGGSGLGLAISKRFIEMHGGRIWVDSDGVSGHGTRFHFTLPVAGAERPEIRTLKREGRALKSPEGRGRTLLLLSQDESLVRMLGHGLADYRVVSVDDVGKVSHLVDELHARAVVVDAAERDLARSHVQALRQNLGDSRVPIILCPLVGERQLGRVLGVEDYLTKPVTPKAVGSLLDRVGNHFRRVLILEDDPQMARTLSRMVRAARPDSDVALTYDGQEGLREMRKRRPDLLLLDLDVPTIDGYGVLDRLREDPELRHTPVVVITGKVLTSQEERALGGEALCVSKAAGFTNDETIDYLRGVLDVAEVSSLL